MKRTLGACGAILLSACLIFGQATEQKSKPAPKKADKAAGAMGMGEMMMKPGPEVKKLAYFIGTWHMEGDMKASPFGPAGKFSGDETDSWGPGRFFVVGRSNGTTPMGKQSTLSVMGWDAQKKTYTFHEYNSMGMADVATGTYENNTWTWSDEMNMGGKNIKGHFIIKEEGADAFSFKWETSTDGGPWETMMEGKAEKKAAAAKTEAK